MSFSFPLSSSTLSAAACCSSLRKPSTLGGSLARRGRGGAGGSCKDPREGSRWSRLFWSRWHFYGIDINIMEVFLQEKREGEEDQQRQSAVAHIEAEQVFFNPAGKFTFVIFLYFLSGAG